MVMLHDQREDEAIQIVLHRLRDVLEKTVSDSHVLVVSNIKKMEWPNLVVPGDATATSSRSEKEIIAVASLLARHHFAFSWTADLATCRLNPRCVSESRRSLVIRTNFRIQLLSKLSDERGKVGETKALVSVGQNGKTDDDVRMRELTGTARNVLTNEWYGSKTPDERNIGIRFHCQLQVILVEKAEADAIDLAEDVRDELVHKLVGQVEHFHVLILKSDGNGGCRLLVLDRTIDHVGQQVAIVHGGQPLTAEVQQLPAGHKLLQFLVVELLVEKN